MITETLADKTLCLPFLGSRQSEELFEYLLVNVNEQSAFISIPKWLINRTILENGEQISLYLKHFLKNSYTIHDHVPGITTVLEDHQGYDNLYQIDFIHPLVSHLSLKPDNKEELRNELIQKVKDSWFLKNGVLIYLKHLIPYFSRILKITEERYRDLKSVMLDDVQHRVYEHMVGLEKLYQELNNHLVDVQDISSYLDLEKLRKMIQSEIDLNLFDVALNETLPNPLSAPIRNYQSLPLQSYQIYLDAIKVVEKRLYDNYNYIVTLYAQSLTSST